jgi:hypothetical protein
VKPTLSSLYAQVLDRADLTGDSHVVEARVREYINEYAGELYDLIRAASEEYFVVSKDQPVVPGMDQYPLPVDFFDLRKVRYFDQSGNDYTLGRWKFDDRVTTADSAIFAPENAGMRYKLIGNYLELNPTPRRDGTLRLYYCPEPPHMVNDDDEMHLSIPVSGWHRYVVYGVCAELCNRREDTGQAGYFESKKAELGERIKNSAEKRDKSQPITPADVISYRDLGWWV